MFTILSSFIAIVASASTSTALFSTFSSPVAHQLYTKHYFLRSYFGSVSCYFEFSYNSMICAMSVPEYILHITIYKIQMRAPAPFDFRLWFSVLCSHFRHFLVVWWQMCIINLILYSFSCLFSSLFVSFPFSILY